MKGLHSKYIVIKSDGSQPDPEARYFVLRYDNDSQVQYLLRHYAKLIYKSKPELAKDLLTEMARMWEK